MVIEGNLGHQFERILPSGRLQLLVNLDEDETRSYPTLDFDVADRHPGATVSGAALSPLRDRYGRAAVHRRGQLRRRGAVPLLAPCAAALAERHVGLADLWGRSAADRLRTQLLEARDAHQRLDVLEAALLQRLDQVGGAGDPVVAQIAAALERDVPVATVLDRVGLSRRAFVARFRQGVGMTPKSLRAFAAVPPRPGRFRLRRPVRWASVAADCGYCDQAHMIQDFRAFSGLTPANYNRRPPLERLHVPVDGRASEHFVQSRAAKPRYADPMSDFKLTPRLVVQGAARALEFYREALGATVIEKYVDDT